MADLEDGDDANARRNNGGSPLELEADPGAAPRKKGEKRRREIPEGLEEVVTTRVTRSVEEKPEAKEKRRSAPPASPLELEAHAAQGMCEVSRIAPGTGEGWAGRSYLGRPVEYARAGRLPNGANVFDAAKARWGGGTYQFLAYGQDGRPLAPVEKTFSGPPLPLDGDGAQLMDWGRHDDTPPSEEFADLETGYALPGRQDDGFMGWIYVHAANAWKWTGPGKAPGRAPPLPGSFDPGRYDHAKDPEITELKAIVRELAQGKATPVADLLAMQQEQRAQEREERRQREDAEARRRETEREEARLRWEKEREERREELEREREEQRRRDEKEREDRREAARLAADAAKLQAEAMKLMAQMQASSAEKVAASATENAKQLVQILTSKSEDGGFDKMLDRLERWSDMKGGNGSDNAAAQISDAIQTAAPAVAGAVRDDILAIKGLPVSPSGQGSEQAARLTDGGSGGDLGDAGRYYQLIGYLVNAHRENMKPTFGVLVHGCLAFNLRGEKFDEVQGMIVAATPEQVVQVVDAMTAKLGNAPQFTDFAKLVRETFLAPEGRAWFAGLQQSIRDRHAKSQAAAITAQQPAPAEPGK